MKQLLILLAFIVVSIRYGYGQTNTVVRVDHYKTRHFDVAIFPVNYIDLIPGKRFTPTRQQIDTAEAALQNQLKSLNQPPVNQPPNRIIHKKLNRYKRQYFGYTDEKDDRILLINCFWDRDAAFTGPWLKHRVVVLDGGSYYWTVHFNLDTGQLFGLCINGEA